MKIGIIGGGQLAKMMILAGSELGFKFYILDPARDACAAPLAVKHIVAEYDNQQAAHELASLVDVVTFDFENVPAATIAKLEEQQNCFPAGNALSISQDRLSEKEFFAKLGIPTALYAKVDSLAELEKASSTLGSSGILKTRRLGYDGKGQFVIKSSQQYAQAMQHMAGQAAIYEQKIDFDYEVSLLGVRSQTGELCFYPLCKNYHHQGILHHTSAPYDNDALYEQAVKYGKQVLNDLEYVGVLAIEFFVHKGELIANEFAPRVHNSGHWSIEGAICSQFENHIRAIANLPLGSTAAQGHSSMLNIIGELPNLKQLLQQPLAHWHNYGKKPRQGRKLGHININAPSAADARLAYIDLAAKLGINVAAPVANANNAHK